MQSSKEQQGEKKAFLSDQYKEIVENNRMGKTRDLFKKIRDTKGTFLAKMDTVKDTNGMNLTEAEEIKKRWQEYTEELYKKDLHNTDNHNGVITHLEPDILECWKTQEWPQDWKSSVFIPIPKKGNAKECSTYSTIVLISHASKIMLKILQARLQHNMSMNFQMFKLVLEKAEEPEIKLPTSAGSSKKQESSRKHLFLLY